MLGRVGHVRVRVLVAPLRAPGLAAFLAFTAPVFAATSYESEPNDTPAEANRIAGEVTLIGTMNGSDQDGFLWTVSDEDAHKRWVLELQGIPGRLTVADIIRVEFADNGIDVAGTEKLTTMGTRDGYTPSITRELFFEPGEYLIGIAYAGSGAEPSSGGGMFRPPAAGLSFGEGGEPEVAADDTAAQAAEPGAYRFIIREAGSVSLQPQLTDTTREGARAMRAGAAYPSFETRESAWYTFGFKPEDNNQRWDLRVQVPVGRVVEATLLDIAGQPLDTRRSGERGYLEFPAIVPGDQPYLLQVQPQEPGFITFIESVRVGQRVEGEEAEPNGQWDLANRIDFAQPLRGAVNEPEDSDHFRFAVDEATADSLQTLRLESEPAGQQVRFCLHTDANVELQCRNGLTPIELPDLLLAPAVYGLNVRRAPVEFAYSISLAQQGPVDAGREVEPNDHIEFATAVPANLRIKGRASGSDTDFFKFVIAEEPQLWRFQVIGEGIREFAVHDAGGHQTANIRPQPGQSRLQLDDMFLLPGKHHVRVDAEDGVEYTVLARALGPPDPNGEREPNDDTYRMQRLAIGQTRTGLLNDVADTDFYRFFLANWDHVKLTVEPPPDGIVKPTISWYDSTFAEGEPQEPGEVMTFAGVLPPGDYYLQLSTNQPSDAEYRLSLERLPRWSCVSDCEPSGLNTYHGASPLPWNFVLEGVSEDWRDRDSYQLPTLKQATMLTVRTAERLQSLYLGRHRHDSEPLQYDQASGSYQVSVPADGPLRLIVGSGRKPYRLELEFADGPQPLADPALAAELELKLAADTVSAFRQFGQVVRGELVLSNSGAETVSARLEAVTSDYRWRVGLDRREVSAAPGANVSVPLEIRVPPDAWADRPVRISARAFDTAGRQVETWADIGVGRETPPLEPAWNWAIPDALRGGFNAAWTLFGAELTGEIPSGADDPKWRDGFVMDGIRTACCNETYGWKDTRPSITLDLPGEDPVPVAGLTLNHFGPTWPYQNLRRATLLLSLDGQSFDEALSFESLPVQTEQYFALDAPVMARYARVRTEETFEHRSGASGVTLGEMKIILAPGHDLSGGAGFDIADPDFGGHLVWDWTPQPYSPTYILDADKPPQFPRIPADTELEYVIGFHENRAARIRRVEWTNGEGMQPEFALERVVVSVSTESPIGPWRPVGELDPGNSPETAVLAVDPPVWARFVKLTGLRQGDSNIVAAPNLIRIWEQPSGPDYRSILAEWGQLNPRGWYEEQGGIPPEPQLVASNNTSRDTAAPLAAGNSASGQVQLAKRSHWYRMTMPADANTLTIDLSGQPTVRTVLELQDSVGAAIPLNELPAASTPKNHAFEARAEPGSTVYFHVYEPPRNVIFSWDTSASVNAHLPLIYNSLSAFVSQVVPGQESANFVPFSEEPLLDTWLGEPYMLQTILNDYPRRQSSSSGEDALLTSAQALAPVAGTKSIVIITDGAVTHRGEMWKEMQEVQPRIFSIGVAGEEEANINLMQDWADVNGGQFTHLRYSGEMEVAFDRASTLMRRPADYTLAVATGFREAPGPGKLSILAPTKESGSAVAGGAVELILDASGSMLQRMNGKRRIVIAREVLTEAVRNRLPAGTPVALRVFGHTEPGTCDTELLLPLGPLDPEVAAATIAGVEARNLAKTPIAASLAAVSGDLGGAESAAVILVTDGEETCEGDPATVIGSLRDRGIDVSVNIVGFAIDDAGLEAQFAEWAKLGGGRYFKAEDEAGLSEAIADALQVPFSVFGATGELVAQGLVGGETVELERGVYRVVVDTSPPRSFDKVDVQGEDEIVLELK